MARFYTALHVPSFIQFTGFRIWCSTDLWSAILDISSANVKACSYLLAHICLIDCKNTDSSSLTETGKPKANVFPFMIHFHNIGCIILSSKENYLSFVGL